MKRSLSPIQNGTSRPGRPLALQVVLVRALAAALLLTVSACNGAGQTALPTPMPSDYLPTAIALTVVAVEANSSTQAASTSQAISSTAAAAALVKPAIEPLPASSTPKPSSQPASQPNLSPTPQPTGTPSPEPSPQATDTPTPGRAPTRTRTPTATPSLPVSEIEILRPGPASKVISPIRISTWLQPGAGGKVQIELLGEDGRLLVRKILAFAPVSRVHVLTDIDFEISGVAEAARLKISTADSYGRVVSLASVDLVLLSIGDEDITPGADSLEPIILREPAQNTLIQGGRLVVSGLARPGSGSLLLVELVARDGRVVGYRQASITPPTEGSHGTFTIDVPYTVTTTTWVRLTVSESGGRIPGPTHISTIEVMLSP